MIVHAFISRNDDWILPHHLAVYSKFCDRIVVVLDRSPQSEAICRMFPKCEVIHFAPDREMPDWTPHGMCCDQGKMRQIAWDAAAKYEPDWIALGDTDEIPTPSVVGFNPDPKIDLYCVDWVNLVNDPFHAIGGTESRWSWQAKGTNKKGFLARWRPGVKYRYDLKNMSHCRMEPNPCSQCSTQFDSTHVYTPDIKLLHWKYSDWDKWQRHPLSQAGGQYSHLLDDSKIVDIHQKWHWINDADEILHSLQEPIAVVGNGVMQGHGAEIDAAATVVRFNNFTTDGYAADVGSKTDVWCTNCWADVVQRPWPGNILTPFTLEEEDGGVVRWLTRYPHMAVAGNSWASEARKLGSNPSTGRILTQRLTTLGKRYKVFGFDGFQTGHYWDHSHKHAHGREFAA